MCKGEFCCTESCVLLYKVVVTSLQIMCEGHSEQSHVCKGDCVCEGNIHWSNFVAMVDVRFYTKVMSSLANQFLHFFMQHGTEFKSVLLAS